jgi:hypothetical protein
MFDKMNIKVPVIVIYHPTDFVCRPFSMDAFLLNTDRMVVQVGGWMRNSYSIYALPINTMRLEIRKGYLKGKMMENYFKPETFNLENLVNQYDANVLHHHHHIYHCHPCTDCTICTKSSCVSVLNTRISECTTCKHYNSQDCDVVLRNKYVDGLVKNVLQNYDSVKHIETLNNDDYDTLLTCNIVFLYLYKASACNTLIEAVVRNVPILINRLPAVEEILGVNYPLYYDTIENAGILATSISHISAAYIYLCKLDKTKLKIETFLSEFDCGLPRPHGGTS